MANSKKKAPAKKKAAVKKAIPPAKPTTVHIVIDINIHSPGQGAGQQRGIANLALDASPNFAYTFTLSNGIHIDFLKIGQKTIPEPGITGTAFVEVLDPLNQIMITVIGTENTPGGSGSLSMTFEGKAIVFNPAANLKISGGTASFNQIVTLP